jgi:hypothetical protein
MLHASSTALGIEMPKTREEFRHLIDTTDHNSPLFRALLELAPAFADLGARDQRCGRRYRLA